MLRALQQGFRLGDYTVYPHTGQVTGPRGTSHLSPKVVDVLMCLTLAPGELVQHRHILDTVWGDPDHTHDALARCIGEIRHCFEDSADNPRYIRTIPRRGYQLIIPVTLLAGSNVVQGTGPDAELPSSGVKSFWATLKKRNVVRVSIAYTAVSWLLLQFAQIAFEALAFPPWALRLLVTALAIGFLIAVVAAWAYQVVPEGQSAVSSERSRREQWLQNGVDLGIISVLTVAVALVSYRQFIDKPVFEPLDMELPVVEILEPDNNSVAVLRFENLGANARFSDGLAENLLHLLAQVEEVSVPSRTTTWTLSDEGLAVETIAEELRVRYILEGSVQQEGDTIRVFAQLIDSASGTHVWSENYDRPLTAGDFFATQDDIASKVVKKIQGTLSAKTSARLQRVPTENLNALEYYLAGRKFLREHFTPDSLGPAVVEFEAALQLDPDYVEAMAGLCEAYLGWYQLNFDSADFEQAEDTCLAASAMDDSIPEVHQAMGTLFRYGGRYDEAELRLQKALQITPNSAPVLEELGRTLRSDNRLIEAEQSFQSAIVAEPRSWSVYKSMGNFLFRTGRYAEAIPYYRQVLTLRPNNPAGYNNFAVTMFMLGRFNEANVAWQHIIADSPTRLTYVNYANSLYYAKDYEQSVQMYGYALAMDDADYRAWRSMATSIIRIDPVDPNADLAYQKAVELARDAILVNPQDKNALSQIAVAYARLGQFELARESLRSLTEIGWENPNISYFAALAHHLLGDNEAAIRELERAIIMGFPRPLITEDPDFQTLSNNKRYVALVNAGRNTPDS